MRPPAYCALCIAVLCLVWAPGPTPATAQGGAIRDLRCENEINPRDVTTQHPRLSWSWSGTGPRAYQILVASSEEKLKRDDGDLWDSGQVRTNQKTAQYQGKP